MEFKHHDDIETFLKGTLEHLEQEESLNNLMLGICNRIINDPSFYTYYYMATVELDGELILAAIMTEMQKLIVYSTVDECDEAIELGKKFT